jgi:hypothetical protein
MRLAEHIARCSDDTEVLALLVRLGISHRLEFQPGVPHNTVDFWVKDHPTHWLFFSRSRGFPEAKDNGYAVVGFVKTAFSEQDFERFIAEAMARRKSEPVRVTTFATGFPQPQS